MTAVLISLTATIIVHMIFSKKVSAGMDLLVTYFDETTGQFKLMGLMIPIAILYASMLNKFGGMKVIANVIYEMSMPKVVMIVILVLLAALVNFAIGSFYGSIAIVMPLGGSVATALGIDPLLMAYLLCVACSYGSMSSPVCPTHVVIQRQFGVESGGMIKRMQIATWGTLIIEAIFAGLYF